MNVPLWLWLVTGVGLTAIISVDFYLVSRNPRKPSLKECLAWIGCYVGLAVLFGLAIFVFEGHQYGGELFAGWITEYSLSVDNLFVTMLIMVSFAVQREHQQKVLSIGIVIALVLRVIVVSIGSAAIAEFDWLFYVFGAFLLYTAVQLLVSSAEDEEFKENAMLRIAKKILPATDKYDGAKITTKVDGKRLVTPMLIVMVAIGTTNLLFAVDSIPAIFGLTKEPYLVLTANAFALMGLRQLYFIIGGLLDRLVYLSTGLAIVLAFIGVKLVIETLHNHGVSWAPQIPILVSLGVIIGTLALTAVVSLLKVRRDRDKELDQVADERPAPVEATE
ncbi:TerC family protein [Actinophytocola sp.]|jgi:tellurite resistance protein TerC|uniref:TerC family protein n=1 Tax=Actinophytocola sp. TaxID=1872138 RepID=UPI002ED9FF8C